MSQLTFDLTTASILLDSSEQFPVDFDRAWEWLGYSRKDKGLDALKTNFVVDLDFHLEGVNSTQQGGRPTNKYYLTIECFKSWGMMAGTEQGKKVRKYFLECEKAAKSQPKTSAEALLESVQMLVTQERRLTVVEQRSTETEYRISNIEQQQQNAWNSLTKLPEPLCKAQPLSVRFALNRLVRAYAGSNSILVDSCYRRLHVEFRDRYHIDLIARGKNQKPQVSGVEYAEQKWLIDHLYAVAVELFGTGRTFSSNSIEI